MGRVNDGFVGEVEARGGGEMKLMLFLGAAIVFAVFAGRTVKRWDADCGNRKNGMDNCKNQQFY